MAMNIGKVATGGLLAGLLFNIGDFVINAFVLPADGQELARRFGTDPAALMSFSGTAPWLVVDFLMGLLVVFTYAAMRPRFGPGPKTAVIAAFVLFAAISLVLTGFTSMGMMTAGMLARGSIASIVNMSIGAIAGASMYSES